MIVQIQQLQEKCNNPLTSCQLHISLVCGCWYHPKRLSIRLGRNYHHQRGFKSLCLAGPSVMSSQMSHFHCPCTFECYFLLCMNTNRRLLHLYFLMLKKSRLTSKIKLVTSLVAENLIRCYSLAAIKIIFLTNATNSKIPPAIKSLT